MRALLPSTDPLDSSAIAFRASRNGSLDADQGGDLPLPDQSEDLRRIIAPRSRILSVEQRDAIERAPPARADEDAPRGAGHQRGLAGPHVRHPVDHLPGGDLVQDHRVRLPVRDSVGNG